MIYLYYNNTLLLCHQIVFVKVTKFDRKIKLLVPTLSNSKKLGTYM